MKVFILITLLSSGILAFPGEKDEVLILPGLRIQPKFKHYSGYLNGSDTRKLHYWFVTSQRSSNTDPLVLWMNGGPGCSSLIGLLTEHGPFRVQIGGYLEYNPYSWNKIANIIYLESPACVGFSYSTDGKCDATDDSTSLLNYNALKDFFIKFPQYKGRDFYITGESYGGIYVPTLAERLVLSKETPYIRFKGIAIGNAYSSRSINSNGNFHFAYNHGLISDSAWSDIIDTCCRNIDALHCDITGSSFPNCKEKIENAKAKYNQINGYNIYSACLTSDNENSLWERLNIPSNSDRIRIVMGLVDENDRRLVRLRQEYLMLKTIRVTLGIDKPSSSIPCMADSTTAAYLNQDLVRFALHIPSKVSQWTVCSYTINYKKIYQDMNRQYNLFFGLKDFRIWLYNGDVDMVCSYLSEEWYFERFNRTVVKTRKPWMYIDQNNSSQIGGFVKVWDRFTLLTVRGSGHMVPTDRPVSSYHMFESFLYGKEL